MPAHVGVCSLGSLVPPVLRLHGVHLRGWSSFGLPHCVDLLWRDAMSEETRTNRGDPHPAPRSLGDSGFSRGRRSRTYPATRLRRLARPTRDRVRISLRTRSRTRDPGWSFEVPDPAEAVHDR